MPCGSKGQGIPTLYNRRPILSAFASFIPKSSSACLTSRYDLPVVTTPSFGFREFMIVLSILFCLANARTALSLY